MIQYTIMIWEFSKQDTIQDLTTTIGDVMDKVTIANQITRYTRRGKAKCQEFHTNYEYRMTGATYEGKVGQSNTTTRKTLNILVGTVVYISLLAILNDILSVSLYYFPQVKS